MPEISDAELREFTRFQLLGSAIDVTKKIDELERDNAKYRARVPKDDEVVLPKAKAKLLEKYEPLGTPEVLEKSLKEGTEAKEKLQKVQTRTSVAAFVKAAGLAEESIDTVMAIPDLNGASFEVRKGKVKDPVKNIEVDGDVAYVKLPGENQRAMTFTEAQESIPALKGLRPAGPTKDASRGGDRTFVPQGGQQPEASSIYDRIRDARKQTQETETKTTVKPIHERLNSM